MGLEKSFEVQKDKKTPIFTPEDIEKLKGKSKEELKEESEKPKIKEEYLKRNYGIISEEWEDQKTVQKMAQANIEATMEREKKLAKALENLSSAYKGKETKESEERSLKEKETFH